MRDARVARLHLRSRHLISADDKSPESAEIEIPQPPPTMSLHR
jgi:hypothetical protein